ncbi:MAG: ABC transporter substrate-binding protein [Gammaproteobacteria bacterium]|nr:ABC transporter substrate-binding protein [Gammaproteobacteria bacterium]
MNRRAAKKVVSLLPAATEMLYALGAEDSLVGISHECDFPERLPDLPRLTRSRLDVDGLSGRIHESMLELVENALSIYEVDVTRLRALDPDIIITQDLCDVCAVSYDDVCAALRDITGSRARIIRLHPERLEDIYDDLHRIGDALDRGEQAANLIVTLKARMTHLRDTARRLPSRSVLLVEWLQPVMIGGLWSADLAAAVGARVLASEPGAHARTLGMDELAELDPDVVVIKPCGFDLARVLEEVPRFGDYFPWTQWRAVDEDRVFIVDGNAYFNRPGPRIVDSAEILAACMYHEEFSGYRRQYAEGVRRVHSDLSVGEFYVD